MTPAELRELLTVLREAGYRATVIPTADGPLHVEPETGDFMAPVEISDDNVQRAEEELPPGAYDSVARRRQAVKAP